MALNIFQTVYIGKEDTFAAHTGDFSANSVNARPLDRVKLEGFVQALLDNPQVRSGWDDLGGVPVEGLKEAKLDLSLLFAGATRSGGAVVSDPLELLLLWVMGTAHVTGNGTVGDGVNASTTTTVYTIDSFIFGVIILINGEARRISAISGTALTLDIPLSSAPADGDVIYGTISHDVNASNIASLGAGITAEDSEMVFLGKGLVPTGGVSVELRNGEFARLSLSLEGADWERGASITPPANSDLPTNGVVVGDGGEVAMGDGAGGRISVIPAEVTAKVGLQAEFVPSVVGVNGKGGFEPVPADSGIELTAYQQATLSMLEGLVGVTVPVVVQIGSTLGKIVGVYYPEATITAYPTPADVGAVQAVKVGFKAVTGVLFRG